MKAGHTGSLDPLATGMLPICFGEATKLSAFLLDADKGYETTLQLGVTTNSADADGEIVLERPVPENLTEEQFREICARFTGALKQIPPMVSAIKIDGQRLYKLAREGKEVERKPRDVTIFDLEVLEFTGATARLSVKCSKGTYIRSLVTDIGEAAGCGAHVKELRRTYVSPFEQHSMVSIAEVESMAANSMDEIDSLLLPMDAGLKHLPAVTVSSLQSAIFKSGQALACNPVDGDQSTVPDPCRVYDENGHLLGLGQLTESGEQVAPKRVLQLS